MKNSIERLAEAIEYPDAVPAGATSYVFGVDDAEILARESGGRLVLERVLWKAGDETETTANMPYELATYAAGRILREEATLAWDPTRDAAILWQGVPASLPSDKLLRFFEVFTASCDWWMDRVNGTVESAPKFPEMVILP